MIKCLSHLAFTVTDMKRALDFYVDGLGFSHAFSMADDAGNPWIEYLQVTQGQFVELFYGKDDFVPGNSSYLHLCLEVDDLEATLQALTARGIGIWRPIRRGKDGNLQGWIRDPDGNPIELMQISPTSKQAQANRR